VNSGLTRPGSFTLAHIKDIAKIIDKNPIAKAKKRNFWSKRVKKLKTY